MIYEIVPALSEARTSEISHAEFPDLKKIAIVGYPDERLSEVGTAFVRLQAGQSLTEDEVIGYCKGKIAFYKIPRYVIFVEDYPMTASGKIKKVELRELALRQVK